MLNNNNVYKFKADTLFASVAYLCMKHSGKYDMLALIKALYIAERECIQTEHTSITWDTFVCRDEGPVLYNLYLLLTKKKKGEIQKKWNMSFSKELKKVPISKNKAYDICLEYCPNLEVLSPLFCSFLDKGDKFVVDAPYGKLVEKIHKYCKEWKKNRPKNDIISYLDILKYNYTPKYKLSNQKLKIIAEDIQDAKSFMVS